MNECVQSDNEMSVSMDACLQPDVDMDVRNLMSKWMSKLNSAMTDSPPHQEWHRREADEVACRREEELRWQMERQVQERERQHEREQEKEQRQQRAEALKQVTSEPV